LAARPQDSEPAWSNVSISRTRSSEIGINEEILQNLLDGLTQQGLSSGSLDTRALHRRVKKLAEDGGRAFVER
jgi:hypothetical protein